MKQHFFGQNYFVRQSVRMMSNPKQERFYFEIIQKYFHLDNDFRKLTFDDFCAIPERECALMLKEVANFKHKAALGRMRMKGGT
jgi:hypothetical protein